MGEVRLIEPAKYKYEVIQGYFLQSSGNKSVPFAPDLLERSFGLLDSSPERWRSLDESIIHLNDAASPGTCYKVFFLGRHGQGYHNLAELKYGTSEWNAKWSLISGDGETVWGPDPSLTPTGEGQALAIQETWKKEVKVGAPVNNSQMRWFVSPLQRTCQTMMLSFGNLLTGVPEVWEDWREGYGHHTCDMRSTKSVVQTRFPHLQIEDGFSEDDVLWIPSGDETHESQQTRARRALDRTFDTVPENYVSVTAHAGIIRSALAFLEHPIYPLEPGEMIPVVLKATRMN